VGGEDEGDGGAVFDDVGDDDRILSFLYVCPFLFVVGLRNGFEVEQFILIPPCSPSPAEQATSFATNIMPLPPTGSQQRQPSSTSSQKGRTEYIAGLQGHIRAVGRGGTGGRGVVEASNLYSALLVLKKTELYHMRPLPA
jgi:hypothetical protein